MIILGIETSCDETAAAVVQKTKDGVKILSNVVASSAKLQEKYGGVIPEQAAREQLRSIIPVIEESLQVTGYREQNIDAIAVTYGPGLIGSLLVGVETAKTLALVWNKPLIPVNHLIGHFYANWINEPLASSYSLFATKSQKLKANSEQPQFPCIGLLVSGGHTDLLLFQDHGQYKYLGGTRDDAAGECFDKCARLLGLPYPGGPVIAKLALQGDALQLKLPRPMIDSKDFDFSFSGLKTSVSNIVYGISERQNDKRLTINDKQNLAASIQQAIIDVLITKTIQAVQKYQVKDLIIAGGVAANQKLASDFKKTINDKRLTINLHIPSANLCTDNAAMIAAAAFFNYQPIDPLDLQANPSLSLA